jgi:hypothetical protein
LASRSSSRRNAARICYTFSAPASFQNFFLPPESGDRVRVDGPAGRENLDRDPLLQPGVLGPVHAAHPTLADLLRRTRSKRLGDVPLSGPA